MPKVIGIGSLLGDEILLVNEHFLQRVPGEKGGMEYLSPSRMEDLIAGTGQIPNMTPGGSTANVLRVLARFGASCTLIAKTGTDSLAKQLAGDLQKNNIALAAIPTDLPTGRVLSLVTPDGQRTMRTNLGASAYWSLDDLPTGVLADAKLVHTEGYLLCHKGLTEEIFRQAKENNALTSFDLSSFEVVSAYKKEIISLLPKNLDLLFANEAEAKVLTGKNACDSCALLKDLCETVVVTMSDKGCWIGHKGIMYHCPAYPVKPLDTTGAGDYFCGGFLHGFLQGLPIEKCAHLGALAAQAVVMTRGTTLPESQWEEILRNSVVID